MSSAFAAEWKTRGAEAEALGRPNAPIEAAAPGLLRLPLPTPTLPPATTTNHIVVGLRDALLVDPATPWNEGRAELMRAIEGLEPLGWHITALLLTHHHADHMGGAEWLRSALDVPILAHAATAERLDGRVRVDRLIEDGDVLLDEGPDGEVWRALWTPGHAPGHLCVMGTRTGTIGAGDMVASEGTILIDPDDGHMGRYLESLARLRAEEPTLLAPAHGLAIRDADATLARYVAHRQMREDKILAALGDTSRTIAELVPMAYDDTPEIAWPLAARAALSHLRWLKERGIVGQTGERWGRA